jgi:hypothetical protein
MIPSFAASAIRSAESRDAKKTLSPRLAFFVFAWAVRFLGIILQTGDVPPHEYSCGDCSPLRPLQNDLEK